MKQNNKSKIIAIDPGYDRMGIAVFYGENLVHSECIVTDKKLAHHLRLFEIYSNLQKIFQKYDPDHLALETLFFSVNKKTAIKVAESRGVALLVAGEKQIPVMELSPQEVKISVTGVGNADKRQVHKMVILTQKSIVKSVLDDEIDAIALGIAAERKLIFQKGG